MITYFVIMTAPVVIGLCQQFITHKSVDHDKHTKRLYLWVCAVFLALILAFRDSSVGSGDGIWYYHNWEYMSQVPLGSLIQTFQTIDIEHGYLTAVWLLSHLFPNGQFIFIFYGVLVSISITCFLEKYSCNSIISYEMFYCLGVWGFMVQGIRQGIAICICLWAIDPARKRSLGKFLLLIVVAAIFHASALAFGIVYFLPLMKIDTKSFIVCTAGIAIIVLCSDLLISLFNSLINDSYARGNTDESEGGIVSLLIYIIILLVGVVFLHGKESGNDTTVFFYMTMCGLVAFVMRYSVNTIVQRIAYYFVFGQYIVLPAAISRMNNKDKRVAELAVVLLCFGFSIYKSTYSVLIPYTFFWQ